MEWSNIVDNYYVSNTGVVRNGNKTINGSKDSYGYVIVKIRGKIQKVHRLVALKFIPNPNNYSDVDHIDMNKSNNKVENLRWCNRSTNLRNRKCYSKTSPYKHIYKNKNSFQFEYKINDIKIRVMFKTITEAHNYRNQFFIDNNIVFDSIKYDL